MAEGSDCILADLTLVSDEKGRPREKRYMPAFIEIKTLNTNENLAFKNYAPEISLHNYCKYCKAVRKSRGLMEL